MSTEAMTLNEFQEQVQRLHKRFPHSYSNRKKNELAFYLSGLPLDWFKIRVDYVLKSGTARYDWIGAAKGARSLHNWERDFFKESKIEKFKQEIRREIESTTGISYEDFLEKHQAGSATEVLERMRKDSSSEE